MLGAIANGCGIGWDDSHASGWPGWPMLRDPGGPRSFPPEEQHEVVALACHPLTELAAARTHWALRPLAEAAGTWGYLRRPVSKSTVERWLKRAALKPHRVRRWLHSPDPDFRLKVRRVVRWYLRPPRRTHVVCVDEKTQVQVLERLHPGRPASPGRPARQEEHYRRHGVLAILAGLHVRSGRVLARVRPGGAVVATYAALDRAAAAAQRLGSLVQVGVARGRTLPDGGVRLEAENPVFVVWGPAR